MYENKNNNSNNNKNRPSHIGLPNTMKEGEANITVSSSKHLGFIVTSDMALDRQVAAFCQCSVHEILKMCAICHVLSCLRVLSLYSVWLSIFDYCQLVAVGYPTDLIHILQKVQNSSAVLEALHSSPSLLQGGLKH